MNKLQYLFLCLLFSIGCTGAQTPDSWTKLADFPGAARTGVASFSIGSLGSMGMGTFALDTFPYTTYYPTNF